MASLTADASAQSLGPPTCFVQAFSDRLQNVVCATCGRALPSLDAAVAVLRDANAYSKIYTDEFDPPHTPSIDSIALSAPIRSACRCREECGALYCSPACRKADVDGGHDLLCVGPLGTDHPLYQFRMQAFQADLPEMILASMLVARFVKNRDVPLAAWCEGLPPWWELGGDGGEYDEFDLEEEDRVVERFQLVHESFDHLCKGMPGLMTCLSKNELNAELFAQLLSFVTKYAVRIEADDVSSRLGHFCTIMLPSILARPSKQGREASIEALTALLVDTAQQATAGQDADQDVSDGDEGSVAPALSVHDLLTQASTLFPGPVGLALYPRMLSEPALCRMPHACLPSCTVAFPSTSLNLEATLKWRFQAPPAADVPWTRSLVRLSDFAAIDDRQLSIAAVTGALCSCPRCLYERDRTVAATLDVSVLHELAHLAQEEGRHKDALAIFGDILARSPDDAKALYGTVRVLSWDDAWDDSVQFLKTACSRSTDSRLVERQTELYAYVPMATLSTPTPKTHVTRDMFASTVVPDVFVSPSHAPLLPPDECQWAVAEVEAHMATSGGWSTSRHYAVPTTDVPVRSIPSVLKWFNIQLAGRLFPALSVLFDVAVERLRVIDAFVVKYDASKQRSLPRHVDQSEYSFTVALNEAGRDYEGGGTFFAYPPTVLNCPTGGVVAFTGQTEHAGYPIFAGTRYIIAVFAYATP